MPAVRRSGFVSFGNADIIKVHSQRVNGRMCAANEKTEKFNLVTKEDMCNEWSIHKSKENIRKMTCQRCRYYYNKDKKQWPFNCIASMDYNVETNEENKYLCISL